MLLVEPSADDRDMYAEYLQSRGFSVATSDTAADSVDRAAQADVIVTGILVRADRWRRVCAPPPRGPWDGHQTRDRFDRHHLRYRSTARHGRGLYDVLAQAVPAGKAGGRSSCGAAAYERLSRAIAPYPKGEHASPSGTTRLRAQT